MHSSHGALFSSALVLIGLGVLGGLPEGMSPARAQSEYAVATFDTTTLPRVAGAKIIHESPSTTIFTAPGSVPAAADAATVELVKAGWTPYAPPASAVLKSESNAILTFKKGKQGLSVFVAVAPAYGNATSIHYTADYLEKDLPFAPDARNVLFDPSRLYVEYLTQAPVDQALEFFEREIASSGWTRWVPAEGQTAPSNAVSEEGAHVFFVRGNERPLRVAVERIEGGAGSKLRAETVPPKMLEPKPAETKPSEAAVPPASVAPKVAMPDIDKLTQDIVRNAESAVQAAIAEAFDGAKSKAPDHAEQSSADAGEASDVVTAMPGVDAHIPLPTTAHDIEISSDEANFRSPASVAALARFYRETLKTEGWSEKPSVINRDTMVVLNLRKDKQELDITIMRMGPETKVMARGDGIGPASAEEQASEGGEPQVSEQDATTSDPELEADETGGLVVPAPHTVAGHEKTKFRVAANASVPAKLATVLAFYRAELEKLGWKEVASGRVITDSEVSLDFSAPEGPAHLALTRKDSETQVLLVLRKTKEAQSAGLLPSKGRVKVMFGNASDKDASVSIGGKTAAVAAGVGARKPDGPTMELAPGSYKLTFSIKGGEKGEETVEVKEGEAWGILIGPGGALPLLMY